MSLHVASAHPVGPFGGGFVHGIGAAHPFKAVFHHLLPFGLRGGRIDLVDADGHILTRGQPGEQRGRLEHHGAFGIGSLDRAAVQHDDVLGDARQPGGHRQDGGLAATGMADQGNEFALFQRQVDLVHHGQRALAGVKDLGQLRILQIARIGMTPGCGGIGARQGVARGPAVARGRGGQVARGNHLGLHAHLQKGGGDVGAQALERHVMGHGPAVARTGQIDLERRSKAPVGLQIWLPVRTGRAPASAAA